MFDFLTREQLVETLNGIIKIGVVSSVNYAKCTARVEFADDDETVSFDMQVLHTNTFRNTDFAMPDVGEDVICIFLPSGKEEGFILGSVYAGTNTPPETTGNYRTVVFSDGTRIRYDRDAHELSAEIEGTSIFANRQDVKVTTPNNVEVTAGNDVIITAANAINITGSNSVTITGTNAVTINSDAEVTVNAKTALVNAESACTIAAPAIALNGNVSVSGNVNATGEIHGKNI